MAFKSPVLGCIYFFIFFKLEIHTDTDVVPWLDGAYVDV